MNSSRFVCGLLLAAVVLASLGAAEASAFGRRGYVAGPGMYYPYAAPIYGYDLYVPYYNPYVAPYPAYGILPPPFATMNMLYANYPYGTTRTAADYGVVLDTPARKRPSLYPAIPFERTPEEQRADQRRVRFEITVPFADAVVMFDGAKTKQTGLQRVFVTPPMEDEKEYSVTISVQWTDKTGTVRMRQKTFNVIAGGSVQHSFIE